MSDVRFKRTSDLAAWFAAGALLMGAGLGCSGSTAMSNPNGRVVTGVVTYNGLPVEGATVSFLSSGSAGYGSTDAGGKFKLRAAQGDRIALGDYQVTIVKKEAPTVTAPASEADYVPPDPDAPPAPEPKDLLPAKYKTVEGSGLTASVTADGKNEFTFPLTD